MGFIFTMMMLFYTFKACEEFYKQRYPEYIFMLLFNAVMTFVSQSNFEIILNLIGVFLDLW